MHDSEMDISIDLSTQLKKCWVSSFQNKSFCKIHQNHKGERAQMLLHMLLSNNLNIKPNIGIRIFQAPHLFSQVCSQLLMWGIASMVNHYSNTQDLPRNQSIVMGPAQYVFQVVQVQAYSDVPNDCTPNLIIFQKSCLSFFHLTKKISQLPFFFYLHK